MVSAHIIYTFWVLIILYNFTCSCRDLTRPVFAKNCSIAELNLQEVNCGCCLHCWPLGISFRNTGFWVGVFCMLYSWKTEPYHCFSAFLSLRASEICLWSFTPLSSVPTTYLTWTWEWIRFDVSGSSIFRALKENCHAAFDNSLSAYATTPQGFCLHRAVWHSVNYFPRFVSTTPTAFLPGNFCYLQAAKQIVLNIFNKHTTIWPQSHLTSSPRVITTLLCNLIFWICDG